MRAAAAGVSGELIRAAAKANQGLADARPLTPAAHHGKCLLSLLSPSKPHAFKPSQTM